MTWGETDSFLVFVFHEPGGLAECCTCIAAPWLCGLVQLTQPLRASVSSLMNGDNIICSASTPMGEAQVRPGDGNALQTVLMNYQNEMCWLYHCWPWQGGVSDHSALYLKKHISAYELEYSHGETLRGKPHPRWEGQGVDKDG